MKKDTLFGNREQMDNRIRNRVKNSDTITRQQQAHGSVVGLRPISLDDGKTIIYVRDGVDTSEVKRKYEERPSNVI